MFCSQYSCSLGCYFPTQQLSEIKKGCLSIVQTTNSEGFCFGKKFFGFLFQFCLYCLVSKAKLLYFQTLFSSMISQQEVFLHVADVEEYLISHISITALIILLIPCVFQLHSCFKISTSYSLWQKLLLCMSGYDTAISFIKIIIVYSFKTTDSFYSSPSAVI